MTERLYTIEQIDTVVEDNGWSITTCHNELNNEINPEYDTIQVSAYEDGDYFGEFFGKPSENKYQFIFYTTEI